MIEFSNCCCCVPLRIGCLIFGYLQLITFILVKLGFIALVVVVVVIFKNKVEQAAAVIAAFVIGFILITVLLTFSLLLVIGIHKDRRSYVKAYLIFYLIIVVLLAIKCIVACFFLPPHMLYIGIVGLIYIVPSVYYLLVIRSYWVTMGNKLNSIDRSRCYFEEVHDNDKKLEV